MRQLLKFNLAVRLFVLLTIWAGMATLWNSGRLNNGPVLCWFRALTGHTCPFCGSTRAVGALCAGDLSTAWQLNPFGVIALAGLCAYLIKPELARNLSSYLIGLKNRIGPSVTATSVATLFVLTWAWNITMRW